MEEKDEIVIFPLSDVWNIIKKNAAFIIGLRLFVLSEAFL